MKTRFLIPAAALAAAALLVALTPARNGANAGDGSVVFSHAAHKDLAECSTCHPATESGSAKDNLLPKPESCVSCHEEDAVRGYWSLSPTDPLNADYLPVKDRRLIFPHDGHMEVGMSCESCHGAVLTDASSGIPDMETCYNCHNDGNKIAPIVRPAAADLKSMNAGNRCESCHVTLAGLIPADHRTANYLRLHGRKAATGGADRDCAVCHSAGFCQECHTPTNDVPAGVALDKAYVDMWPRGEKIDDGDLLTVQKVHSLTYRYTHGLDARARSSRCESCHESETFCAPCHRNGYDATGVRVIPQSHQLAGFAQSGGPKSMNRHGKLAKMDIARCATCHDVDGADPVCAMCHSTGLVTGGVR